jgi:enamine deaminase RidA (YjgF/YER057c/UK114 family)
MLTRTEVSADAVIAGDFIFINGVLPVNLEDETVALNEYIEEQTEDCLANAEIVLKRYGLDRSAVVAVRVAMTHIDTLYKRMDGAYIGFFASDKLPTRSVIGVAGLPRGATVQMDFVARKSS